ncbi:hypothetical protein FRC04_000702 [Tulasnella sp. 424]|nr:hypothetical protein FRC04_000702 [Tulasnella sp. 424]KAG8967688.1 hypothetical protein FRC05_001946 [Tulasnella sp. 425]
MAEQWKMSPGNIAVCDPETVLRFLGKNYLVIESKANRDILVELCYLVVLLDSKHDRIPQRLDTLVHDVMKDPQTGPVEEAVSKLKEYAAGLDPDPRTASSQVAKAWQETKKLREGRVGENLDDIPIPQALSPCGRVTAKIPIQVKVWSQTRTWLDTPCSEIRCVVPDLAMISNIHDIIRYAASNFNFPCVSGQRQPKSKKLDITFGAILYEVSADSEWNMIEKSAKLAAVKDATSLQLVNTRVRTAAVAVVVRARRALTEPFLFENPLILAEAFKFIMERREIIESIDRAQNTFIQTRFLSITSEEMGSPPIIPLPSSNHTLQTDPITVSSGFSSPPGTISSSSLADDARLLGSPALVSEPQPPSALPPSHPTPVVGAQPSEAVEHSPDDTRSPSPTESHYSAASEEMEPPTPYQVHHDPGGRLPARPPQVPPPTNRNTLTPSPSASSTTVGESSVTPTSTISNPEHPSVVDSTKPEQKQLVRRGFRRIGW